MMMLVSFLYPCIFSTFKSQNLNPNFSYFLAVAFSKCQVTQTLWDELVQREAMPILIETQFLVIEWVYLFQSFQGSHTTKHHLPLEIYFKSWFLNGLFVKLLASAAATTIVDSLSLNEYLFVEKQRRIFWITRDQLLR